MDTATMDMLAIICIFVAAIASFCVLVLALAYVLARFCESAEPHGDGAKGGEA